MIVKSISWQLALTYSEIAKRVGWRPEPIGIGSCEFTTNLMFTPSFKVRDIRNWIHQAVGSDYSLAAVFKKGEKIIPSAGMELPHLLRFTFNDEETAMLFKLTWL